MLCTGLTAGYDYVVNVIVVTPMEQRRWVVIGLKLRRAPFFLSRGCAEAKATCSAKCQACGRVLMQGEAFHISKALTSCGHEGCTGCVKAIAALTNFPSLELIESWQDAKHGCM